MAQPQGFDLSKLSTGEKIAGISAAIFFIWVFIPTWYSCCSVAGTSQHVASASGFRGFVILSWLAAVAALAEIVLRKIANVKMNIPIQTGQLHLILAGIALVGSLLGLVVKPGFLGVSFSISWGLFVGIIIAAVWTYGAYMMYSEPAPSMPAGGDSSSG